MLCLKNIQTKYLKYVSKVMDLAHPRRRWAGFPGQGTKVPQAAWWSQKNKMGTTQFNFLEHLRKVRGDIRKMPGKC